MNDRDGVMMSAVLMLIAATRGTDADVAVAKKGDGVAMAYLAGKYMGDALAITEQIRATMNAKSDESEETRS